MAKGTHRGGGSEGPRADAPRLTEAEREERGDFGREVTRYVNDLKTKITGYETFVSNLRSGDDGGGVKAQLIQRAISSLKGTLQDIERLQGDEKTPLHTLKDAFNVKKNAVEKTINNYKAHLPEEVSAVESSGSPSSFEPVPPPPLVGKPVLDRKESATSKREGRVEEFEAGIERVLREIKDNPETRFGGRYGTDVGNIRVELYQLKQAVGTATAAALREKMAAIDSLVANLRKEYVDKKSKVASETVSDRAAIVRPPEETPAPKLKERVGTLEVDANLLETAKETKKEYGKWIKELGKSEQLTEAQKFSIEGHLRELENLCNVLDRRRKSPLSIKVVPSDMRKYREIVQCLEKEAGYIIEPPEPPKRGEVYRALARPKGVVRTNPEDAEDLDRLRKGEDIFAEDEVEFGPKFRMLSDRSDKERGGGKPATAADSTNLGPYVSPWGLYNERDFYKPGGETESTEKNGGADSEAPAFVPPQFVKQTENEKAAARFESFADVKNEAVRLSSEISKAFAALLAHAEIGKVEQDPELRGLLGEAEKKTDTVLLLRNQITDLENDNTLSEEEKRTLGEMSLRQMTTEANDVLGLIRSLKERLDGDIPAPPPAEGGLGAAAAGSEAVPPPPDLAAAELARLKAALPSNEDLAAAFGSVEAAEAYAKAIAENTQFRQEYRAAKEEYKKLDLMRQKDQARQGPVGAAKHWFSKEAQARELEWQKMEAKMVDLDRRRLELFGGRQAANEAAKDALRSAGKLKELPPNEKKFDVETRVRNHFVINKWNESEETRLQALAEVAQERNGTWAGKTLNTIKGVTTTLGKHRMLVRGVGLTVAVGVGVAAAPAAALAAGATAGATYAGRVLASSLGTSLGAGVGRWLGTMLVDRNLQRQQEFKTELGDKKLTLDNFEQLQKEWSLTKEDERKAKKIRSVATVVLGAAVGGAGYFMSPDIGLATARGAVPEVAPAPQPVPESQPIEHVVRPGDHSLWRITERKFASQLDALPTDQKNRLLMETFNEIQADPSLRTRLGLRPNSTVDQIYAEDGSGRGDRLNLRVIEEILERKTGQAVPQVPNPAPVPVPAVGLEGAGQLAATTLRDIEGALSQKLGAPITLTGGEVPGGVKAAAGTVAGISTLGKVRDKLEKYKTEAEPAPLKEVVAERTDEKSNAGDGEKTSAIQKEDGQSKEKSAPRSLKDMINLAEDRANEKFLRSEQEMHVPPGMEIGDGDSYDALIKSFETQNSINRTKTFLGFFDKEQPHQVTFNLSFKELQDSLNFSDRDIRAVGVEVSTYRKWVGFIEQCVENLRAAGFRQEELDEMSVGSIVLWEAGRLEKNARSGTSTN